MSLIYCAGFEPSQSTIKSLYWTQDLRTLSTPKYSDDEHSLAHDAMSGGGCYGGSEDDKKDEDDEQPLRKRLKIVTTMDAIVRHGS